MDRYLKESEAAEYLAVSVGTLRNWRSGNQGPVYRKPETGLIRYTVADLDEFMQKRGSNNATADN